MTRGWGSKLAAITTSGLIVGVPVGDADAQDAAGLQIDGSVRLKYEIDDNGALDTDSPGSDTKVVAEFGLKATSETPTTRLSFELGADAVQEDLAARVEDNGLRNPFWGLSYATESAASTLSLSFRQQEQDLQDRFVTIFDEDGLPEDDLTLSGGSLLTTNFSGAYEIDTGAPLSGAMSLYFRDREYKDTVASGLYDSASYGGRLTTRFRLAPTARARVFYAFDEYDAGDSLGTERTTERLGVGLDYEINPILRFDGEIAVSDVERTLTNFSPELQTDNDGITVDATLTRDMVNGSAGLSLTRDIGAEESLTQLSARRTIEFPAGEISVELGVSDGDGGSNVIGGFDYRREFKTGVLRAGLDRSTIINVDDEERIRTQASIGYAYEISPLSDLKVDFSYGRSEIEGVATSDVTNSTLSVTYSRELTEDWSWDIGYRGRRRDSGSGASARSDALITSIGRSFSIRP